jgi:glucosamine-6-phosphate isomerase
MIFKLIFEKTSRMSLKVFRDYNALSLEAANAILAVVERNPRAVLCLASGDSPRLAYQFLIEKAEAAHTDLSRCTFIALDEWVGIPPDNEGSCAYYLNLHLFSPLSIEPRQIHLFDAMSQDLAAECRKMDEVIRMKGGIDLILVGVGMNGHVGFNEPGIPADLYSHIVALDAVTREVGQKYFDKPTALSHGITLGLKHFLESRQAIMIASGRKKAAVIRQAWEADVSTDLPASIIRKHPRATLMLDEDAGSALRTGR